MRRPRFGQPVQIGFPFVVPDPFGHIKARLTKYTIWRGYLSQLSSVSAMFYGIFRFATFVAGTVMAFLCWLRLKEHDYYSLDLYVEPLDSAWVVNFTHWIDGLQLYFQFASVLVVLFESVVICDEPFGMAYGPRYSFLNIVRLPYYLTVAALFWTAASISTADLSEIIEEYQFEVLFNEFGELFGTCERDTRADAASYCVQGSHISWVAQLVGYSRSWLFAFGSLAALSGIAHVAIVHGPDGGGLDQVKQVFLYLTAPAEIVTPKDLERLVNSPIQIGGEKTDHPYAWTTKRWYDDINGPYAMYNKILFPSKNLLGKRGATLTRLVLMAGYVVIMLYAVSVQLATGLNTYDWSYNGLSDALNNAGLSCTPEALTDGSCDPLQGGLGVNEASSYAYALKILPVFFMLIYVAVSVTSKLWSVFMPDPTYYYTHTAEYLVLFYSGCFAAVESEKFYNDMAIFEGITQTYIPATRLKPKEDAVMIMQMNFACMFTVLLALVVETIVYGQLNTFLIVNVKDVIRFVVLNLPYPRILMVTTGGVFFGPLAGLWLTTTRSEWHFPFWGFLIGAVVGILVGQALSYVPIRKWLGLPQPIVNKTMLRNDPLRPLITNKLWRIVYPIGVFLATWASLALFLGVYTEMMTVNFSVGGSLKSIGQVIAILGDMAMAVIVMFVKVARLFNPCMNDIEPPRDLAAVPAIGLATSMLENMWKPILATPKDGGILSGEQAYCFVGGRYNIEEPPAEGFGWHFYGDSDDSGSPVHRYHQVQPIESRGLWNQEELCDGKPITNHQGRSVAWDEKCSAQHESTARRYAGVGTTAVYGKCMRPDTGESCGAPSTDDECACFTKEWAPPTCRVTTNTHLSSLNAYMNTDLSMIAMSHYLCKKTYGNGLKVETVGAAPPQEGDDQFTMESTCDSSGHCTVPIPKFKAFDANFGRECPDEAYRHTDGSSHYKKTMCEPGSGGGGDTYCTEEFKAEDPPRCPTVGEMFDCGGADGCPDMSVSTDLPRQQDVMQSEAPEGFDQTPIGCNKAYAVVSDTISTNLLRSRNALRKIFSAANICCDADGSIGKGPKCDDVWKETSEDLNNARGEKLDDSCSDDKCAESCLSDANSAGCSCEGAKGSCQRPFDVSAESGLTISYNEQCLHEVCVATGATIMTAFAVALATKTVCSLADTIGMLLNPWPFGAPIDILGGLCSQIAQTIAKVVRIAAQAARKVFEFGKKIGRGIRKMITKRKSLMKVVDAMKKMIGTKNTALRFQQSMLKGFIPVWATSFFVVMTGFWRREPRSGGSQSLFVLLAMAVAFMVNVITFVIFFGVSGLVENASQLTSAVGITESPPCSAYNGGVTTTIINMCGTDELPSCQEGVTCFAPNRCTQEMRSVVDKPPDYIGCVTNTDCKWYGNSPPEGTRVFGSPPRTDFRASHTLSREFEYLACPTDPYELDKINVPCFEPRQCPIEPTLPPTMPMFEEWTKFEKHQCDTNNPILFDISMDAINKGGYYEGCNSPSGTHTQTGENIGTGPCPVSCVEPNGDPDGLCVERPINSAFPSGLCNTPKCTMDDSTFNIFGPLAVNGIFYKYLNAKRAGREGYYMYMHEFTDFGIETHYQRTVFMHGEAQTHQLGHYSFGGGTDDLCKEICEKYEHCGGYEISRQEYEDRQLGLWGVISRFDTHYCRFFRMGDCTEGTNSNLDAAGWSAAFRRRNSLSDVWIRPGNVGPGFDYSLPIDSCYEPYEVNPGECVYRSRMEDPYFERGIFVAAIDDILATFSNLGVAPGEKPVFTARAEMLEGADMIKWGIFMCLLSNIIIGVYYGVDWLADSLESFPLLSKIVDWMYGENPFTCCRRPQIAAKNNLPAEDPPPAYKERQKAYKTKLKKFYDERMEKLSSLYKNRKTRMKLPKENKLPPNPAPLGSKAKWDTKPLDDDIGGGTLGEEVGTTFGGWLLALLVLIPVLQNMVLSYGTDVGWNEDHVEIDTYTSWLGVEVGAPLRMYTFAAGNSPQANEALKELAESGIFGEASGGISVDIDSIGCDFTLVGIIFKKLLGPILSAIGSINLSGLLPTVNWDDILPELNKLDIDLGDLMNINIRGIGDLKRFWTNLFDKLPTLSNGFYDMIKALNLENPFLDFNLFKINCIEPDESNNYLKHTCRSQCHRTNTNCKDQCRHLDSVCKYKYPYRTTTNPFPGVQVTERESGQFVAWSAAGIQADEPCARDPLTRECTDDGLFDGVFSTDVPCPKRCYPGIPYYNWEFWIVNFIPMVFCFLVATGTLLALTMPSTRRPAWVAVKEDDNPSIKLCGVWKITHNDLDGARRGALGAIRATLLPLATMNIELVVAIMSIIEMFGGIDAVLFTFKVGYGEGAMNALVSSMFMTISAVVLNVNVFWPVDG